MLIRTEMSAEEKAEAKRARKGAIFQMRPIHLHLATNSPGKSFARAEKRRQARAEKKATKHARETSAKAALARWPLIRQQRREDRAAGRAS